MSVTMEGECRWKVRRKRGKEGDRVEGVSKDKACKKNLEWNDSGQLLEIMQ